MRRPAVRDTRAGRVVVVTRHPRAGREIRAWGGPALFRDRTVLDIGTGNGRLAFDVARYARRVIAIDPSEGAIEIARRRADALGVRNVDFRVDTAQDLATVRERVDVSVFTWSL
jgi:ubiquinone/menaquinone biosynthesis C-methylase UbiE